MTFNEQLNEYISKLGCTAKDLMDASGLSASVLSRYRAGSRLPEINSGQFLQLVQGIVSVAAEKGRTDCTADAVSETLRLCITEQTFPFDKFQANFDALLTTLSVNVADLSHFLNFDSSYISRIRNGQRRPADPQSFSLGVSKFVVSHCSAADKELIAGLIGCDITEISDDSVCMDKIVCWLANGQVVQKEVVLPFLTKLDEFDLNEFIRSIHFDELKVPSVPFQFPASRNYYGIEEMCKGTLDFFKATVLSKSKEDLIANDDTPMADKANGTDFKKKFIFAVAMTLKKGLHIHFIHNINRPFEEMMMGLEGWIPMYMTGQISPYYLKGVHNKLFGHFLYSSGAAALSGECIMDHHQNGKMYLTNNKTELAYYRQRALDLLSNASPLMDIYRVESESAFSAFVKKDCMTSGKRRSILSALPIHTLSEELLLQILGHNSVDEADKNRILAYAAEQRQLYKTVLEEESITDEIPVISESEFKEHPMLLPLSEIFYEKDIAYTYEEYLLHMDQTLRYSQEQENYIIKQNSNYPFRNIQIRILEGKWVVISKNKAPAIHFVIHNPQLRNALENMTIPVYEENIEE